MKKILTSRWPGLVLAAAGILAWVLLKKKPAPDALYVNRKPAEPESADGKDTDD